MKILVTGGAGYLGSVLIPKLIARGHQVKVIDVGYFGVGHLRTLLNSIELVREDIRRVITDSLFCQELLDGCDCVIHLAAISNDPSAELNPELTEEVNFLATQALAEAAKKRGIRFLFSSSCSVYGEAPGELDENGALNPLTAYAVSKVKSEQVLEELADSQWSPVILRNGTLFGYSPRMRFDLVINIFSLYSTLRSEIKIFGDGQQWRPFLHLSDCARAFVFFAEKQDCRYRCYNISHKNLRVVDVAETFQHINPRLQVSYLDLPEQDHRDYRVSTQRMSEEGFEPQINIELGIQQMVEAIISGLIPDPESIYYRNAKWLKELTSLSTKDHREIVGLMEVLASVRQTSQV
jgi:nucleoside-diphosphate-sugar epimerase